MHNTIIIGAGPAGIAAAIQLRRASVDFLLLEKGRIGGLLLNANLIENYPGFTEPISGPDLVQRFKTQIDSLGIKVLSDEVVSTVLSSPSPKLTPQREEGVDAKFSVSTNQMTYKCKNLIVASGTKPKRLSTEDNVCYEVYPLLDLKDKDISIIGGGDAAFDYALNLAKKNRVKIFYGGEKPKCLPILHERVMESKNIDIIRHPPLQSPFRGRDEVLLAAIGREPNIDFLVPDLKIISLQRTTSPDYISSEM